MNYNAVAATGEKIIQKIVKKADDCIGKALVKTGNAMVGSVKIPDELADILLWEAGVNVKGKNARRLVEAALKNQALCKIDGIVGAGCKIATADAEPGIADIIVEGAEAMKNFGIMKNLGFANAADNARNILAFRHENLSLQAQNVIAKYLKSPVNVAKVFQA